MFKVVGTSLIELVIVMSLTSAFCAYGYYAYLQASVQMEAGLALVELHRVINYGRQEARQHGTVLELCAWDQISHSCGLEWSDGYALTRAGALLKWYPGPRQLKLKAYLAAPQNLVFDAQGHSHQNGRFEIGRQRGAKFECLKVLHYWREASRISDRCFEAKLNMDI